MFPGQSTNKPGQSSPLAAAAPNPGQVVLRAKQVAQVRKPWEAQVHGDRKT